MRPVLRLNFSIALSYEITQPGCDFIFNIHAAQTAHQTVVWENLHISQPVLPSMYTDTVSHNRYLRLKALAGPLTVRYEATVDLAHHVAQPLEVAEVPVAQLPGSVLPYIYPSRYCESDRLHRLAVKEFGHLPQGYSRVQAICAWVTRRVTFRSNSSNWQHHGAGHPDRRNRCVPRLCPFDDCAVPWIEYSGPLCHRH